MLLLKLVEIAEKVEIPKIKELTTSEKKYNFITS